MSLIDDAKARVDALQQRNTWLARVVAVGKKFSDDEAGHLAAVVAFYGFLSLFPLILVFVVILLVGRWLFRRFAPSFTSGGPGGPVAGWGGGD